MNQSRKRIATALLVMAGVGGLGSETGLSQNAVRLPTPLQREGLSVERALQQRKSVRDYSNESLSLTEISQLLWAAQGLIDRTGRRTTPSAGALYPLEIYLVAGNVTGLSAGIYKYIPSQHALTKVVERDLRAALSSAALGQAAVANGAAALVVAAVYERTTQKYGDSGRRYVDMEAGHAAQNVYLEAAFLKLGTVVIGALNEKEVIGVLRMPPNETPLSILPIGRIREAS